MTEDIETTITNETQEEELFSNIADIPKILAKMDLYHSSEMNFLDGLKTSSQSVDRLSKEILSRIKYNNTQEYRMPDTRKLTEDIAEILVSNLRERLSKVTDETSLKLMLIRYLLEPTDKVRRDIIKLLAVTIVLLFSLIMGTLTWYSNSNAHYYSMYLTLCQSQELTQDEKKILQSDEFIDQSLLFRPMGLYPSKKKKILKAISHSVEFRKAEYQLH